MLISEKNKKTIDACRFCWMCRHICPIGNATGQERNNARGRALSLSMVERGMDFSPSIVDNLYECALCGACTKECVTGWDPVEFTKAARLEAAVNGILPEHIYELISNIENTGNPYGKSTVCDDIKTEIENLPKKADVLLFLGTDARYVSCRPAINAIKLLKKANVNFTVLVDEPESGYVMDVLTGRSEETRQIMIKTAEQLDYKTVVAFDPADAKVFLREYKEWGIEIKAVIKTFTGFVNELIKNGSLKPVKSGMVFTYQDPALLARDLDETKEAREILSACGAVREMLLADKDTMWAGNLLMNEYMPQTIKQTAKARWKEAMSTKADILVTASPSEYEILLREKPEKMKLSNIDEIVLNACN